MRVVIAPDKFKGSLSAPEVVEHLATGLLAGFGSNGLETTRIPVADGGEGTIDAAIGSGFTRRTAIVTCAYFASAPHLTLRYHFKHLDRRHRNRAAWRRALRPRALYSGLSGLL